MPGASLQVSEVAQQAVIREAGLKRPVMAQSRTRDVGTPDPLRIFKRAGPEVRSLGGSGPSSGGQDISRFGHIGDPLSDTVFEGGPNVSGMHGIPAPLSSPQGETTLMIDEPSQPCACRSRTSKRTRRHRIEALDGAAGLKLRESDLCIDPLVSGVGSQGRYDVQVADAGHVCRPHLRMARRRHRWCSRQPALRSSSSLMRAESASAPKATSNLSSPTKSVGVLWTPRSDVARS